MADIEENSAYYDVGLIKQHGMSSLYSSYKANFLVKSTSNIDGHLACGFTSFVFQGHGSITNLHDVRVVIEERSPLLGSLYWCLFTSSSTDHDQSAVQVAKDRFLDDSVSFDALPSSTPVRCNPEVALLLCHTFSASSVLGGTASFHSPLSAAWGVDNRFLSVFLYKASPGSHLLDIESNVLLGCQSESQFVASTVELK